MSDGSPSLKFPVTPPAHVRSLAELTAEQRYLRTQIEGLHAKVDKVDAAIGALSLAVIELMGNLSKEVQRLQPEVKR